MKDPCTIIKFSDPERVKGQVASLLPRMGPGDKRLSLALYRLLSTGKAPTRLDLANESGFSENAVQVSLETWSNHMDIDSRGFIFHCKVKTTGFSRSAFAAIITSGKERHSWDLSCSPGKASSPLSGRILLSVQPTGPTGRPPSPVCVCSGQNIATSLPARKAG